MQKPSVGQKVVAYTAVGAGVVVGGTVTGLVGIARGLIGGCKAVGRAFSDEWAKQNTPSPTVETQEKKGADSEQSDSAVVPQTAAVAEGSVEPPKA